MKTKFLSLVFLLIIIINYSQNIGDFKSITSGNWADKANWQTYNGTTWVAATQYPGQTSGNYTVTIDEVNATTPHIITVSSASTYSIGNLVVKGQLTLNADFTLSTTNNLTIDAGTVYLDANKLNFTLPANAQISIINTGSGTCNGGSGINGYGITSSNCNNNNSLIIGTITYSNCAGTGGALGGTFCTVNTEGGTIKAVPTPNASSICYNSSINNTVTLTAPTNTSNYTYTYAWSVFSAPSGFTGFTSTNTTPPSFTFNNLIVGTYVFKLKITATNGSNSYSSEGTTTVNVYQPITPGTLNSISLCSRYNTGNSLTLSGSFGNIVKWQSSTVSDFSSNVSDIANTQSTLTLANNINATTYYRAVLSNGNCNGFSPISTVGINSTTYNGSSWSNGNPDTNKKAIFTGSYTLANDITACSTEITNNAIVTIPDGKNLTISNELQVTSGNLIVESGGNLKQVNDTNNNSGSITVKRKAKMKLFDYTYWGSPVASQQLKAFSPSTQSSRFYTYNEGTDKFSTIDWNTNFTPAKGYAIRAPNDYTTSNTTADWSFTGAPNNGSQSIAIAKSTNGYNLVSNPYPSNISFNALQSANSTIINPIAYFWTNTNINPPQQQGSTYSGNNYAIRNSTGGTAATGSSVTPTDEIVVGQGFIVQKIDSGSSNLTFNNSMRRTAAGNFFNMRTSSAKVENPKYWLKLTTPVQNFNTLLVGYVNGATNGIDPAYDAEPLSDASDLFYSIQDNKNLIIQGRDSNFSINDVVPLGANFYEAGNYEISIAQAEGIFNGSQAIYLRDKTLNTTVNLSEGAYQFFANAGATTDRFEVVYQPDSSLGIDNGSKNKETIIYENSENIFIENKAEKITEVQIFDASGRLLYVSKPNHNKFSIEKSKFSKGLLIFKINLKDKTTTKKFLLR